MINALCLLAIQTLTICATNLAWAAGPYLDSKLKPGLTVEGYIRDNYDCGLLPGHMYAPHDKEICQDLTNETWACRAKDPTKAQDFPNIEISLVCIRNESNPKTCWENSDSMVGVSWGIEEKQFFDRNGTVK